MAQPAAIGPPSPHRLRSPRLTGMDAAILGPILGLLTLVLIWMRQDLVDVRAQLTGVRERLARIEGHLGLREDAPADS